MALAYDVVSIRNVMLDAITSRAGASALLRFYDGTRPATAGAITTQVLLAELTCSATFAPAAAAGVLTANAITQDSSANASGTVTWLRLVKSDGTTFVLDGNVAAAGSDLNLTPTAITLGQPVQVSSWIITEGNP